MQVWNVLHAARCKCRTQKSRQKSPLAALLHSTLVVGASQTLRRWTEGATDIRQSGHHVGHWPTFLVLFNSHRFPGFLQVGLHSKDLYEENAATLWPPHICWKHRGSKNNWCRSTRREHEWWETYRSDCCSDENAMVKFAVSTTIRPLLDRNTQRVNFSRETAILITYDSNKCYEDSMKMAQKQAQVT